jgi:hypothetical protein
MLTLTDGKPEVVPNTLAPSGALLLPHPTAQNQMNDLPNFAAWSNKNLANFAAEAYIKMKEQQETIEQAQQDFKDAMAQLRKLTSSGLNRGNSA